jgi:Flp pilus assembly protein TadG
MKPRPRDLRNRHRSGNTMIELALTFLPTFALLFAFIDFGLALFAWTSLQNAVREGCRYAITYQSGAGGQDAAIKAVVQQYSMGFVSATATPAQIVVNYYAPSAPNTVLTGVGSNAPGNIVEVKVQNYSWTWIAPLSGSFVNPTRDTTPLAINVSSFDVMGGFPSGVVAVAR